MQIHKYKSWIFLAVLTGLVLVAGEEIGGRQGLLLAFVIALLLNYVAFFYSAGILMWTYNARLIEGADPYGLRELTHRLAKKADIAPPEIYILPTDTPNIFAFGRSVNHSAIAVTEGALTLLSKDQLEGVMAHELSHILNHDTFLMMITAGLSSMVMYVATFLSWLAACGRTPKENRAPSSSLGRILTAIIAPFGALLVQVAVRKNREFQADLSAAELTGKPDALAQALWKIHHYSKSKPMPATAATAHMFIINPLAASGTVESMFSTHPEVEERIKRLSGRTP